MQRSSSCRIPQLKSSKMHAGTGRRASRKSADKKGWIGLGTNRPAIQSSDPEWIEQSRRVGFRSERHGQRDDGGRERTAHLGDAVEREPLARFVEIGRASGRERVCQYV